MSINKGMAAFPQKDCSRKISFRRRYRWNNVSRLTLPSSIIPQAASDQAMIRRSQRWAAPTIANRWTVAAVRAVAIMNPAASWSAGGGPAENRCTRRPPRYFKPRTMSTAIIAGRGRGARKSSSFRKGAMNLSKIMRRAWQPQSKNGFGDTFRGFASEKVVFLA